MAATSPGDMNQALLEAILAGPGRLVECVQQSASQPPGDLLAGLAVAATGRAGQGAEDLARLTDGLQVWCREAADAEAACLVAAAAAILGAGLPDVVDLRPLVVLARDRQPGDAGERVRAAVGVARAFLALQGWNFDLAVRQIEDLLLVIPSGCGVRQHLVVEVANRLGLNGQLRQMAGLLGLPGGEGVAVEPPTSLLLACFCDAVECGRLAEAEALSRRLIETAITRDLIVTYRALLTLQRDAVLGVEGGHPPPDDPALRPLWALGQREERRVPYETVDEQRDAASPIGRRLEAAGLALVPGFAGGDR